MIAVSVAGAAESRNILGRECGNDICHPGMLMAMLSREARHEQSWLTAPEPEKHESTTIPPHTVL